MTIRRFSRKLLAFLLSTCMLAAFCTVDVSANTLSDSIFQTWEHETDEEFGDIYACPDSNCDAGTVIDYCISIVNEKKGELINDEYSVFLFFTYKADTFSSYEDYVNYYTWNIYYPLFALYPESAFCATARTYYGQIDDTEYMLIIEICTNGKSHNYSIVPTEVNGEIFNGFENYQNENQDLAKIISDLANDAMSKYSSDYDRVKYIYDYLVETVEYDAADLRSHSSYGALIDKKAVCEGYAAAIYDACCIMDIPCVMNFSMEDEHAWNSVYIEGKWKFVDATNKLFMTVEEEEAPVVYEDWQLYDYYPDVMKTAHSKIEQWNIFDVDGDGNVTSMDALSILDLVVGSNVYDKSFDVDRNGEANSYDALLLLNYVVGA